MEILISGASTGIGRACAIQLARLGHSIWAGVRHQRHFDELSRLKIDGLNPIFLDVTDEKSITECVRGISKKSGILHGLINNAGIAIGGPVEAVPISDWRRQFETNLFGAVSLTQACLPLLRESKGRIVNVSSIAGRIASPFMGPYAASKFALEAVSDSLRREMRRHGVTVAIVEPGPIATPIWEKAMTEGIGKAADYPPSIQDIYGKSLEKFGRGVEETVRTAAPVDVVVEAVVHAMTSPRPRLRYPVGRGIRLAALLAKVLPDTWFERLAGKSI